MEQVENVVSLKNEESNQDRICGVFKPKELAEALAYVSSMLEEFDEVPITEKEYNEYVKWFVDLTANIAELPDVLQYFGDQKNFLNWVGFYIDET